MENIIQSAKDKKYTEFSNAVKDELKSKLSNHEISQNYASEYDRIQQMKDVFSQISSPKQVDSPESSDEE